MSEEDRKIGELVVDISEQTSRLVRDEIELAKAEVASKLRSLGVGAAVVAVSGIFLLAALIVFMHAFAWFLNDLFGVTQAVWLGFLVEALIFVALAVGGGLFAYRSFRRGAPPTPEQAIEEAERTLDAMRHRTEGPVEGAAGREGATVSSGSGPAAPGEEGR